MFYSRLNVNQYGGVMAFGQLRFGRTVARQVLCAEFDAVVLGRLMVGLENGGGAEAA